MWRLRFEWGDLVVGLSVLSKANEEGDQRGATKLTSLLCGWQTHCKHLNREREGEKCDREGYASVRKQKQNERR